MSNHTLINMVSDRIPRQVVTLSSYVVKCKKGDFKNHAEKVRNAQKAGQKELVKKMKESLPCIIVGGVAKDYVKNDNMAEYSQMLCIDIDKINSQGFNLVKLRKKIESDPYTRACVMSISGLGLAVFVKVGTDMSMHKEVSLEVIKYISAKYGITIDEPASFILSMPRIVSYDPDAYYNAKSLVWHYIDPDIEEIIDKQSEFSLNVTTFANGSRNTDLFLWANRMNEAAVPIDDAIAAATREFAEEDFKPKEVQATVESAYKNTEDFGKVVGLLDEIGGVTGNSGKGGKHQKTYTTGQENNTIKNYTNVATSSTIATSKTRGNPWVNAPLIPKDAFPKLKTISKLLSICKDDRERSVALISFLTMVSACLPKVTLLYNKRLSPNLFFIVLAAAGEGKGLIDKLAECASTLDRHLREDCNHEWSTYITKKGKCEEDDKCTDPPEEPCCGGMLIADDATTPAFIDELKILDKCNLLISTEIDTLNRTNRGDHFEKSDIFRKLFHNETIQKSRKMDNERTIVYDPVCSILLAGTPGAVLRFVPMTEDGTTSRFLFFGFGSGELKWISQQGAEQYDHIKTIDELGDQLIEIYEYNLVYPFAFEFTDEQTNKFDDHFEEWTSELDKNVDEDYFASLKRLAVSTKRIACVLTAMWRFENSFDDDITYCTEEIFNCSMKLANVFRQHNRIMYDQIKSQNSRVLSPRDQFFEKLPTEFLSKDAYAIGKEFKHGERTVRHILKSWEGGKLQKIKNGEWKKV